MFRFSLSARRISGTLVQLHALSKTFLHQTLTLSSATFQNINHDGDQSFDKLPIAHIKATYNNTIVTVTDYAGKTLNWASGGQQGFKGAKRKTTTAAEAAGLVAAQVHSRKSKVRVSDQESNPLQEASLKGMKKVRVKVKGLGPRGQWVTVQSAVKGLQAGGLDVMSITDVTPVPHNGCKPRKARRI
jgi:small subunit ribosomal protein S11